MSESNETQVRWYHISWKGRNVPFVVKNGRIVEEADSSHMQGYTSQDISDIESEPPLNGAIRLPKSKRSFF